jgi:hypothetical protein
VFTEGWPNVDGLAGAAGKAVEILALGVDAGTDAGSYRPQEVKAYEAKRWPGGKG